jgi:polysaccharide pyruvyl transferase WcaK-like protein
MNKVTTIIYGALTKPTPHSQGLKKYIRRAKRIAYEFRDSLLFLLGKTTFIDYRNYESEFSSNIGDIAISDAISELLIDKLPGISIEYLDWGHIDTIKQEGKNRISHPLIVAGGGYILIDSKNRLPSRLANDLFYLRKNRQPLIFFGIGLNRPNHLTPNKNTISLQSDDASLLREILNYSQLISVRDNATKSFLETYTDKNIHLIGDPALFLRASDLSTQPKHIKQKTDPEIGLNFSFHGPTSTLLLRKNLFSYIKALKKLQFKTNCRFTYFVHYDTERLIPRLLKLSGIQTKVVVGLPQQIIESYRQLDLHISGMLHSCILAHNADVPCIALSYDIKHIGFFKLFGLQDNCQSATDFNPDKLIERALYLINNPKPTQKAIKDQKIILKSKLNAFTEECISILNKI